MPKTIEGWPVMLSSCASCPFRNDGSIEVRNAVMERISLSASQICHHPRASGRSETHLCRGARDWQLTLMVRLGWLLEATDAAFEKRSKEMANG